MGCFGSVSRAENLRWKNSSPLLPEFHFHEIHRARMHADSVPTIIQALKQFDMQQDVIARTLMAIRKWPEKLLPGFTPQDFNLHRFTLLNESAEEITFGLVGRFWRLDMGLEAINDAQDFIRHDNPLHARLIVRNQVFQRSVGEYEVMTETFIYCPTPQVKRRMLPYWLTIRPASGLIRLRMLKLVQQNINGEMK